MDFDSSADMALDLASFIEGDEDLDLILNAVYGYHIKFVGEENFFAVKQAVVQGKQTKEIIEVIEGGEAFDWQTSIGTLKDAIEVVAAAVAIYDFFDRKYGQSPNEQQLKESLEEYSKTKKVSSSSVKSKLERIAKEVLKQKHKRKRS